MRIYSLILACASVFAYSAPAHAFTMQEIPICVNILNADINLDCLVDIQDLTILQQNFGRSVERGQNGDLNDDAVVNDQDLAIIVQDFGRSCDCETPAPVCPQ